MATKNNLIGELMAIKQLGQKPNYSDLQRKYGTDRHTIKKYFEKGKQPYKARPPVESKYDAFRGEVESYLSGDGATMKAAYMFLAAAHPDAGLCYNGFKSWCRNKGVRKAAEAAVHPRFETPPGKQAQFDWKEDVSLTLSDGEVLRFNVFTMTFSWSRMHMLVYSETRSEEDLIRCLIECVERAGGVPRGEFLTDNMSAVVSFVNGRRRKHPSILALEKDMGCRIALCKPKSPQTKGKDESANRFVEWLMPYDGRLGSREEVVAALARVEAQCNSEPNRTTGMPPIALWRREKEALLPAPRRIVLEGYLSGARTVTVPSTCLVPHGGKWYSVPPEYVGRRVTVAPASGMVYVYHDGRVVAVRREASSPINYEASDYVSAMAASYKGGGDIEQMAMESLACLAGLGRR